MQLNDYLKKEGISIPKFARRLGVHHNTVYLWLKRLRDCSRENAQAVQDATKGDVTIEDMIYLKEPRKKCPICGRKLYKNLIEGKCNELV